MAPVSDSVPGECSISSTADTLRLVGGSPSLTVHVLFFFFLIFYLFIIFGCVGSSSRARALSSCGKRGPLLTAVLGPLFIAARAGLSPSRLPTPALQGTGSRHTGSVAVAHGPSRSAACGILPDQGSNPCPLHWQADSQPLRHQESPQSMCFLICVFVLVFGLSQSVHEPFKSRFPVP